MKKWLLVGLVFLGIGGGVGRVRAGDEACTNASYPTCYSETRVNQWSCESCTITSYKCSTNLKDCTKIVLGQPKPDSTKCTYADGTCLGYCTGSDIPGNGSCAVLNVTVACNTSQYNCGWTGITTDCEPYSNPCEEFPASEASTEFKSCCGSGGAAASPSPVPSTTPAPSGSVCVPGTPTTPITLVAPPNGSTVVGVGVTLSWNPPTNWRHLDMPDCSYSDYYKVYVRAGSALPSPNPTSLAPYLQATTTNNQISNYAVNPGTTYYWLVEANNSQNYRYSSSWSFNTLSTVSGSVYDDINNTCSTTTKLTTAGMTVSLTGGYSDDVGGAGNYYISAPVGTYTNGLSLSGYPAGYLCSTACPLTQKCNNTTVVIPSGGLNNQRFFLTQIRSGWWQADGAGVYAGSTGGGTTILSQLPLSTSRMIVGTTAPAFRASGSIGKGAGQISDTNINAETAYTGIKTDYNYFVKRMGILSTKTNDWGSDVITKPTGVRDYWYIDPTSASAKINNTWTVTNGQSYVVFIKGDLEINQNVTVNSGGFLIFIVDGSVTVDPSVSNIQGLYVMDGQFITTPKGVGIYDDPLVVNGSVITWTGVSLGRNLGLGNTDGPAEKFVYRPDFLVNMPVKLKGFIYTWQEVAPGTYGN